MVQQLNIQMTQNIGFKTTNSIEQMAQQLNIQMAQKNGFLKEWDVIVPVPLHPLEQKRRGYNQSEKFADGLAKPLELRVANLLERRKFTETQTKKSRLERLENVDEVFG